MLNKNNTLWTEKYRPTELQNYIGNDVIKFQVDKYIKKNDLPNCIFYGPTGTGKTTLAKLIAANLRCEILYINASDDNGIEIVRTKIKDFASAASFSPLKIVIYDDAHNLTVDAQNALLPMMEQFSAKTRFIITTNHLDRLIEPLRSRCKSGTFEVLPPSKKDVKIQLATILEKEGVTFDPKDITAVVNKFHPDIRSSLLVLQESVNSSNNIELKFDNLSNTSYLCSLLDILKAPGKDAWNKMRQIMIDCDTDYSGVFSFLYNSVDEYSKGKPEEIVLAIAEAQRWHSTVPDREINVASLLLSILKIIK